jgi:hypothetical protein
MEVPVAKFTDGEYDSIDRFLKELFLRVEIGRMTASNAHADAMHVLTAFDKGNETEVLPYIGLRFAKWLGADSNA